MNTTSVKIWVYVDQAGDAAIGLSEDEARDSYKENIDGDGASVSRMVKVTLNVPLPNVTELVGNVPAEKNDGAVLQVA